MPSTQPTQDTHKPDHDETVVHVMTSNPEQDHYVATGPGAASSNKKTYALVAALLFLLVGIGIYSLSSSNKPSTTNTTTASLSAIAPAQVAITSTGFVPATVTVKVGQAVTWINTDTTASHLVASDPYPTDNALAGFDSKQNLATHDRYGFIFDKAGTYTYHDDLNPYTIKGIVVVKQ